MDVLPDTAPALEAKLAGTLLGTALGDALGLPAEGMPAAAIARRFGRMDRFRLLGRTGYVSDDTEQSALVAQSLVRFPDDPEACAADFRRALLGWFLRLPWGVGLATVKSCCRMAVGVRPSGVRSAGNGAAMRAAVIGVFLHDRPEERRQFGTALAQATHTDSRAVAGALFVAELAAFLADSPGEDRFRALERAAATVEEPSLAEALHRAGSLAGSAAPLEAAAAELGTSGFVLHTVPFAAYCFLRWADEPMEALTQAIGAGGDTDSIAAILGAWLGALHGESGLPADLLAQIHDGPFGPSHLRALAAAMSRARVAGSAGAPRYSAVAALARNLALYPVVLYHGFRRLLP
jgi:ADP-ribosylglycohydrolase